MRRTLIAALAVLVLSAPAAQAADGTYVRDPLSDRLVQKPKKLSFRDLDLTGLRWIHWGRARAIARGRASLLICEPNCADGRRVRGKVRIVVRRRVQDGDRRVYQCIEGRVTGVPRAYSRVSWGC